MYGINIYLFLCIVLIIALTIDVDYLKIFSNYTLEDRFLHIVNKQHKNFALETNEIIKTNNFNKHNFGKLLSLTLIDDYCKNNYEKIIMKK